MKYKLKYSFIFFFLLILFSCGKESNDTGSPDPVPDYKISFYVVDSLGNLVFPSNGQSASQYEPSDFYAYSDYTQDIGEYNSHPEYGHVFRVLESYNVLNEYENDYLTDSILNFYICFGNHCDTIQAFNITEISQCSAETLFFAQDTINDYNCSLVSYEFND
jgi:hypothetical protein